MATATLDASAILAMLLGEPGAARVEAAVDGGVISSVNWSEVVARAAAAGSNTDGLAAELVGAGVEIVPFDREDAERAAALRLVTAHVGLSLADRACLATAERYAKRVLTADRAWSSLELDVSIEVIR